MSPGLFGHGADEDQRTYRVDDWRSRGEIVEVEIGDGNGHVRLGRTDLIWCLLDGRPSIAQWFTTEPVPAEGTRVEV